MKGAALLPGQHQKQRIIQGDIDAKTMRREIRCGLHQPQYRGFIADLRIRDQDQVLVAVSRMFRSNFQDVFKRRFHFRPAPGFQLVQCLEPGVCQKLV